MPRSFRRFVTLSARSLGLALTLVASAAHAETPPAHAETSPDCPTWFPDFQCDRQGRPDGFVAPATAPFLFEDPFITTGVSAWYLWHAFPSSSPFQGGHVNVVALQARIAITDRLALIATRDGYAWTDPKLSILDQENGLMDLGLGLKYLAVSMPEHHFYLSPSLRFDIPSGSRSVFQGNGDGTIVPGLSAAYSLFDRVHFLGNTGVQFPFDGDNQATMLFWNLQMDFTVVKWLVPFAGLNGYYYLSNGDGDFRLKTDIGNVGLATATNALGSQDVNGMDYGNLGNKGVSGNTIATLAAGARIPIGRHVSLSAAYEIPVTHQQDVIDQRVTTNLMFEF